MPRLFPEIWKWRRLYLSACQDAISTHNPASKQKPGKKKKKADKQLEKENEPKPVVCNWIEYHRP